MSETNTLENTNLSPEEILGPPRIDLLGLGLIAFFSLVVGLLVGVGVFMLVYFSIGEFSLHSGASSILMSMLAFVCLTLGNLLYTWGLSSIFPHIYNSARTMFVQISVFSIILYICMSLVYFIIGIVYPASTALLSVYAIHVVLNTFGLFLVTGILSQYKYSLLTFYSGIVSLIITGITVFWVYNVSPTSSYSLFLFFGLTTAAYMISSTIHFGIGWIYGQIYIYSGSDPLGDVLSRIKMEEESLDQEAEKSLFRKK